jgi:hypothetical protein
MNQALDTIFQSIASHLTAYGVGSGVLVLAAATTMPKPGTPLTWGTLYQWFYETIQTALPVNRGPRPSTIPQPVPAALEVHQPVNPVPNAPEVVQPKEPQPPQP